MEWKLALGMGGGQRVQELDTLLPKGPLMKSSGFTKPQPRLTLLFVFLETQMETKSPGVSLK